MADKLPPQSGIYQILCRPSGKVYVGSAVNLSARWQQHRRSLRRGKHHNGHLQAAWDKYGEAQFEFSVLEVVSDAAHRLEVEQAWIDKTGCADPNKGYNIFDTAGSPGDAFVQVWEGFIDPNGNAVTITNLFDFCRRNELDWASMHRLAMGKSKLKSYKGWTHKNSVRQREFIKTYEDFIDPEGRLVGPITNLAAFCRRHGLDNTHMVALARGRLVSHRGWTFNNGRPNRGFRTYTGFIDPDGQRVTISNLQAFCRENNLTVSHMRAVKSGNRKSHKGWRWSNLDE